MSPPPGAPSGGSPPPRGEGPDPELYEQARALLEGQCRPLTMEQLWSGLQGTGAPGAGPGMERLAELARLHPNLILLEGGRVGLADWMLRGHRFRYIPSEEDVETGRFPASNDLLYFYLRPGIVHRSRTTTAVWLVDPVLGWEGEGWIAVAGEGSEAGWCLEGLSGWIEESGLEYGDEVVFEVRSYSGLRFAIRREGIREVSDERIDLENGEVAERAYTVLQEPDLPRDRGAAKMADLWLRMLGRKQLDYEVPPDPLPRILEQDERFVVEGRWVWLRRDYERLHPGGAGTDPLDTYARVDPGEIAPEIVDVIRGATNAREAQDLLCEHMVASSREERRHLRSLAACLFPALSAEISRPGRRIPRGKIGGPAVPQPDRAGVEPAGGARSGSGRVIGFDFRERRRLGEDEPCPCGSGSSYGECCGSRKPGGGAL